MNKKKMKEKGGDEGKVAGRRGGGRREREMG